MRTGPQCEGCKNAVEGTVTVQVDGRAVEERDVVICPLDECAHEEEDTQERIDEDARKPFASYWVCYGFNCDECPAKIDGKDPSAWYGVRSCAKAQALDLLRRQRELCERGAK